MTLQTVHSAVRELKMGSRFLLGLRSYLRRPLTLSEAHDILQRRLKRRREDFLDLLRRAVFESPSSPYHPLLERAGCVYHDLENLVQKEGIEGALAQLFEAGVYLTVDEYKGRHPVVRGNTTFTVRPDQTRNPILTPHLRVKTSGSRGVSTRTPLDLACVRDHAVNTFLTLHARGGLDWRTAVWALPGIVPILWFSMGKTPPARWFWNVERSTRDLPRGLWWKTQAVTWTGRLAGIDMPNREFAPYDDPGLIAGWIRRTLDEGQVPHLWTCPSSAIQLCRVSRERGIDLSGAQFTLTGEPICEAHLCAIREMNAQARPDYGSVESGGSFSSGCLSPEAPDELHLHQDLITLIQVDSAPFPRRALLLSSLRPAAPFVFLNVSMGDTAVMTQRRCGCPMQDLGWTTHLHTIRSYEKLSAGGVTFIDTDVIRILTEVLPRRFGGGPNDYQLAEATDPDGRPGLRLRVHPRIGPLDSESVATTFLESLASRNEADRLMAIQWRQSGFLDVQRRAPSATSSGKILHLHAGEGAGVEDV